MVVINRRLFGFKLSAPLPTVTEKEAGTQSP